jgi:hypothetical protein
VTISKISIKNIRGIKSLEIPMASITLISGDNGEGKTSILSALAYFTDRGHNPDMLRVGATSGEAVVTFSNGQYLRLRITPKGTERLAYDESGKKLPGGYVEHLQKIIDALSFNPLKFLDMTEKEQAERLLKLMQIEPPVEEITAALGTAAVANVAVQANIAGKNGLECIDIIDETLYAHRTGVNKEAETLRTHSAETEKALPPAPPAGNWDAEVQRLRVSVAACDADRDVKTKAINAARTAERERLADLQRAGDEGIDADINRRIAALQSERYERKAALAEQRQIGVDATETQAATGLTAVAAMFDPKRQALASELAVAEERSRQDTQSTAARKSIDAMRAKAATLEAESRSITEAKKNLAAVKSRLLEKLPIKGYAVKENRVYGENEEKQLVPLSVLNTHRQIVFCLRMATMSHGEVGVVLLDGAERFGSKNKAALIAAAKKYADEKGMQFIIAERVDCELKITDDAGAPLLMGA